MTEEVATFVAADYAVFGVMLALSASIGLYYAYKDRQGKEGVQGYLLAARQMNFFPVAISLALSFVSAVTVLGVPAEIHFFGSMYVWVIVAVVWVAPVVAEIYIPVFYRLEITSAFEYIEMRFNRATRLLSTFIFLIQNIMYIGIMIYAPALALSSVTNFNLWAAVATIGIVCTFYTTLGGLKAVIWTDVFQGLVLLIGMIVTLAVSVTSVGGFNKVWEACREGGRIDFINFQTDPRYRNTFWSMVIGLGFLWLSVFGTNQSQVQRYLSCKTEYEAKKGFYVGVIAAIFCLGLSYLTGFVTYAYFKDCDPLASGKISQPDQILPYMILLIFNNQPGLPGLFVAGLFAGCLSTVSSGINAMACVTVKDFIQPFVGWSQRVMTWVSKGMVFLFGALCIGFAILASTLGGVLQASLSVLGLVGGPLLGLFSLGITFPCANSPGAISGLILGISLSTWIYIGSTIYAPLPKFMGFKSLSIDGCAVANVTSNYTLTTMGSTDVMTTTVSTTTAAVRPPIAEFYSVSYAYYAAIGYGATLICGLVVSLLSCGYRERKNVDPRLILPLLDHKMFCWLPSKFRRFMWCGVSHEKDFDEEKPVKVKDISLKSISPLNVDEAKVNGDVSSPDPPPYPNSNGFSQKSNFSDSERSLPGVAVQENGETNQAFSMEDERSPI
uniref:sodium-coupled monocarboxylate transporter 1-like n=1 Tax=Styela clava TaxID=7725 RepID=UPI00193A165B|nr:sodium-coupled monocarboxylate transporter 1-like [Styela clava]